MLDTLKTLAGGLVVTLGFILLQAWCVACIALPLWAIDRAGLVEPWFGGWLIAASVIGGLWFALWTLKRVTGHTRW